MHANIKLGKLSKNEIGVVSLHTKKFTMNLRNISTKSEIVEGKIKKF